MAGKLQKTKMTETPGEHRQVLLRLENNRRYAHTAKCSYQLSMASLQPDDERPPDCVCGSINDERRNRTANDEKVIVIVEHNLKEHVLCVLDQARQRSCKLNLLVEPGEQIAFRTIGKVAVQLSGTRERLDQATGQEPF